MTQGLVTQELLFQAWSASQAADIALALFFAALVGTALFFSHTATSSLPDQSDDIRFAESELRHYAAIHRSVRDRAEIEVDPRKREFLQRDLRSLRRYLDQTQGSLDALKGNIVSGEAPQSRRTAHQRLRTNLRALESAGGRAVEAVMNIDLMPQAPSAPSYASSRFMPSTSVALGSDLIP